jgi:hypothetical protein
MVCVCVCVCVCVHAIALLSVFGLRYPSHAIFLDPAEAIAIISTHWPIPKEQRNPL